MTASSFEMPITRALTLNKDFIYNYFRRLIAGLSRDNRGTIAGCFYAAKPKRLRMATRYLFRLWRQDNFLSKIVEVGLMGEFPCFPWRYTLNLLDFETSSPQCFSSPSIVIIAMIYDTKYEKIQEWLPLPLDHFLFCKNLS